jgi:class 3 adenylate cyclase/uncharacterized membrane protein SirB2
MDHLFDLNPAVDWAARDGAARSRWSLRFRRPDVEADFLRYFTRPGMLTSLLFNGVGLLVAIFTIVVIAPGNPWIASWFALVLLELVGSCVTYLTRPADPKKDARVVRAFELVCVVNAFGSMAVAFFFAVWVPQFVDAGYGVKAALLFIVVIFAQVLSLRVVTASVCLSFTLVGEVFESAYYSVAPPDGPVLTSGQLILMMATSIAAAAVIIFVAAEVELTSRRHFVQLTALHVARHDLQRAGDVVQGVLRTSLPRSVMLRIRRATSLDDAFVVDDSPLATVSVCGVSDFARFSTLLLPMDVVELLHRLFSAFDRAVRAADAVKALTYGDTYVACAGLLSDGSADAEPEAAQEYRAGTRATMMSVAIEQVRHARQLWHPSLGTNDQSAVGNAPQLRAAVGIATGAASGGMSGRASFRFQITGPAFTRALQLRDAVASGGGIACDDATVAAAAGLQNVTAHRVMADVHTLTAVAGESLLDSASTVVVVDQDAYEPSSPTLSADFARTGDAPLPLAWSPWSLRFRDAATQQRMDEFAAGEEVRHGSFASAAAAAVPAAMLVFFILDRASVTPVSPFRPRDVLAGALLVVSSGLFAARGIAQRSFNMQLPTAPDAMLVVVALWAIFAATFVAADTVVANDVAYLCFVLGGTAQFLVQRMPWVGTAALLVVGIFGPLLAVQWSKARLDPIAQVILAFGFCTYVALAYTTKRFMCLRFGVTLLATSFNEQAQARLGVQQRLLRGLLPQHVVDEAAELLAGGRGRRLSIPDGPQHVERWSDLVLVQLRVAALHDAALHGTFADLCDVTAIVQRCVEEIGRDGLEVVQAIGDTFLVAGPLGSDDEDDIREAAVRALKLVRALPAALGAARTMTAALVCESAFGALLGSQMLSFRLFGVAVHRSDAILAAAPNVPGRSVAVASDQFRRIYDGGVLPPTKMGADMSVAVMEEAAVPLSRRSSATGEAVATAAAQPFGARTTWRLRGAGACVVSAVSL